MQIHKHDIATKFLLLLLLTFNNLSAQVKNRNEFILKGKVNYPIDRFIYFVWYNADEQRFLDSAKVTKGKFYYKGVSNGYLDRFYIKTNPSVKSNNDYQNNVKVPIDNSVMNLELKVGQFSKYKLVGCKSCDLLGKRANYYENKYGKSNEKYQKIATDYRTTNAARKKYEKLYNENNNKWQNEILKWCIKNPDNNLTPLELLSYLGNSEPLNFERYYNGLTTFQKNSFYGQSLKNEIAHQIFLASLTGTTATNFEKPGFDSTVVNLSFINANSFVLLDFWGSWCTPCRASHPDLIKLYQKVSL